MQCFGYNSDWVYNEAKTLQSLDHPNIVKYIDHFREGNKLYIVMEYADGGDLRNKLKNHKYVFHGSYPEHIILQLCEAIKYIHDRDIVHRDLKPTNIFSTHDGDVKLGDFGISKKLNGENIMRYSIYMNYSIYKAPELQKSESYTIYVRYNGPWMHHLCFFLL